MLGLGAVLLLLSSLISVTAIGGEATEGSKPEAVFYLLSTESQVLAAILALLLAATIAAASLAVRYTWRTSGYVLGLWLIPYGIAYAAGLSLPVGLLHFGFTLPWTRAATLLFVVCIALLVPFVLELRAHLNMVLVVRRLGRAAWKEYGLDSCAAQNSANWSPDPSPAALTLLTAAYSAYSAKDFSVFRASVDQVGILASKLLCSLASDEQITVLKDQLTDLGRSVNESPSNPALRVMRAARQLARLAIREKRYHIAAGFASSLGSLGRAAVRSQWRNGMEHTAEALECVGMRLEPDAAISEEVDAEGRAEVTRSVVRALAEVGAGVMRSPPIDEQGVLNRFYDALWGLESLGSYPEVTEMVLQNPDDALQKFVTSYQAWRMSRAS